MGWPRKFWCFAFQHSYVEATTRKYPIQYIPYKQFYHKMAHGVLAKVQDDTNGRVNGLVNTSDATILDWLPYLIVESKQGIYFI